MRELRAVIVGASPLLSDLIRRAAGRHLRRAGVKFSIVAELADPAELARRLADLTPDLIIFLSGEAEAPAPDAYGGIATLTLSSDLSRVFGPGPEDVTPLTPKDLAARIVELATAVGPLLS